MIAHEVTASLYIQTRTSQALEHIPTAAHNNNNGATKNLNAHQKKNPLVCQSVRRRHEANDPQEPHRIPQGLHLGHQASRASRIRLSWPQLSQESIPWPDWKAHTQKSLEWLKSVQWKPEWLKGTNLEEEIMSASRSLRSEWRKAKDSLAMHRVPIGDWLSLKDQVLEGSFLPFQPPPPLPPPPRIRRRCVPSVVVYDTGLCTREEDDPASAVLYFRPRHTPTTARTSLAGQLAGVVHFCRQAFDTPTVVRTRHAHIAFKDYGRFVLMVCGRGGEWARSRLLDVCRQLDAATGGLPHMWLTCGWDHRHFTDRLTEVLDALLPNAIPDAEFGEEDGEAEGALGSSSNTTPLSTPSPATEASELGALEDDIEARRRMGDLEGEEGEEGEGEALRRLHRIFNAVPSVQLPKSGGGVFLKAQQVVEACQQQPGVLAGATMHKNRVLNTQMDSELTHVLASLPLHVSKGGVLEERNVDYRLPADVHLLKLHVPAQTHAALRKHMPKPMPRRGERGLHSEAASMDLASLRSVLQSRQSLHSYPSSLPVAPEVSQERSASPQPQPPPRGPSLLARISGGLEAELRPSQSLPGSPRKIRVAATLPDVGTNSPDLRYKVLTGRRPRPPASSHSTPRRMPGGRNGIPRNHDGSSNGFSGTSKRSHGLCPPSLTRGDKRNNKLISEDGGKNPSKLGYDSEKSESGFEDGVQSDSELNIKNTKNKLNLHLAPDKINRPSHEIEMDGLGHDEPKIRREINGNLAKDDNPSSSPNGNLPASLKTQLQDFKDESDTSRSEESDISVLDLSKYVETKENGDRQLAEAVKGLIELTSHSDEEDTRPGQGNGSAELRDSGDEDNSAEGWRALTLYTQKLGDTVLHLLLSSAAYSNPQLVYTLWRLGLSGLEDVQKAVERALEVSEGGCGGDAFIQYSYSVLSAVTPCILEHKLVSVVHEDFLAHRHLMEVTIRSDEAVVWGHRHSNTETFYQVSAAPRPGLPIPSDVMAKVPHRARRRLDRDHNITLL